MRELKFRVWNGYLTKEYKAYDRCYTPMDGPYLEIKPYRYDNDYAVEQYTGLKDKNGKEIYEGDIIREKWFDEDARRGENRVGKCEYFTDGFVCWFVGGRFIPLGMFPVSHIEVIGNIHENAELLKKEK